MSVLNDWLRSRDMRPAMADAVYTPSYCLAEKESRLTEINQRCTKKAVDQVWLRRARHLILSCAYPEHQEEEFAYKEAMLIGLLADNRLGTEQIHFLEGIRNSVEEAEKLAEILRQINAHSLIVVAERWHLPRVLYALRRTNPRVYLFPIAVVTKKWEVPREPSRIKRLRAIHQPLWIAWNVAGYLAVPFLVKKEC